MRFSAIHEFRLRNIKSRAMLKSCRRQFIASHMARLQHILNENSISRGGIAYHHVRDGADQLAVLDDGATRHKCDQVGITHFNVKFTKFAKSNQTVTLGKFHFHLKQ